MSTMAIDGYHRSVYAVIVKIVKMYIFSVCYKNVFMLVRMYVSVCVGLGKSERLHKIIDYWLLGNPAGVMPL